MDRAVISVIDSDITALGIQPGLSPDCRSRAPALDPPSLRPCHALSPDQPDPLGQAFPGGRQALDPGEAPAARSLGRGLEHLPGYRHCPSRPLPVLRGRRSRMLKEPELETASLADPRETAESAGLVYVSDEMPGIRRRRSGKGFSY